MTVLSPPTAYKSPVPCIPAAKEALSWRSSPRGSRHAGVPWSGPARDRGRGGRDRCDRHRHERLGPGTATGSGSSTGGFATVKRRNLIATDTESGTLGYAESQTVYDRLNGTITSLPSVGQVVRPGQSLYRVDDSRWCCSTAPRPAYRDLAIGRQRRPGRVRAQPGSESGWALTAASDHDRRCLAGRRRLTRWTYGRRPWGSPRPGTIPSGRSCSFPALNASRPSTRSLGSTGQSAGGASGCGFPGASSAATPVVAPGRVRQPRKTNASATRQSVAVGGDRRRAASLRGGSPDGAGSADLAAIL